MEDYLRPTETIDCDHPRVSAVARELSHAAKDPLAIAKRCFEWVRDEIRHSGDYRLDGPVTCSASEVLAARVGLCYGKSHLLAALLRANSIPAGLCYQRFLAHKGNARFGLHGLNAVYLPDIGWYRIDPRGNKEGVDAQFTPPAEKLAFTAAAKGEADLPEVWPDALPQIVSILRSCRTYDEVLKSRRDIEMI